MLTRCHLFGFLSCVLIKVVLVTSQSDSNDSGSVFTPGWHYLKQNETGKLDLIANTWKKNFLVDKKNVTLKRWIFQGEDCVLEISCLNLNITQHCDEGFVQVSDFHSQKERYCGNKMMPSMLASDTGDMELILQKRKNINLIQGSSCSVTCKASVAHVITTEEALTTRHAGSSDNYLNCSCGYSLDDSEGRIVGGSEAPIGKYPWMAALIFRTGTRPFCGASLLNDRYAVTAAHCIMGSIQPEDVDLILRDHDYKRSKEVYGQESVRVLISEFIPHPEFSKKNIDNDIALVKLEDPIPLDSPEFRTIVPVCLPEMANRILGKDLSVTGWGTTAERGKHSSFLRETEVTVLPHSQCRRSYSGIIRISERMLCASWESGGRDACQGDSGGPLVLKSSEGYYELMGVVSFGFGCGRQKYPGIYTRVSSFLPWIDENTADAKWCRKRK
ncbi:trypsin-1-like [Artemia franciscana]|uniref:Peptidase S1 domain-containing protein n=1 Tax=Artemia franciscana TaxID=6661 RepID=A0AA88I5Z3_ARTSF|nr:hypothetical protein QYM36_004003 [Artemia franciscana]